MFASGAASSLSSYVILFYDYLLTLSMEVDRYWRAGSHTWASTLFLVLRYGALIGHVPLFYNVFADPCKTPHLIHILAFYHYIFVFVLTALTTVLLVMRVYALYFRNRWVLCLMSFEYVAAVLVACWAVVGIWSDATALHPNHRTAQLKAVAFSGLLVFDFTVFVLTVASSIRIWTRREPFIHRLVMDGLLYYGVIWNLNLLNIVVLAINPVLDLSTPMFTNILSVVMVSRLMLNLRDPNIFRQADRDGTLTTVVLDDN
ncbi:hypothetical protein F5148DRAFT_932007 [Russula earlei]|uniref:Uncharacterized protein n=1 Tax=Russula earlei TaxID=71964 RepID=A0ACC0UAX6_9AGAM|nr:hypothetical protein F5148DRAFT_932007 [Russula earlei]